MSCSRAGALGQRCVDAQLAGDHSGDMRDLYGMLEHVLPIAGAELQPAEDFNQLVD